jgi:broad specificity phosphatase PhoE
VGLLVLVRHGQASLGSADYDRLSEKGALQAQAAGVRLARADLKLDRVACGAMARQRDTALAVLAELGLPGSGLQADDRLDEYDHVGVMTAHTSDVSFETATPESGREVQAALDEAIGRWMAGGSGYQESHADFIGRVLGALRDLTSAPGNTLAITSGGVIAAACAHVVGLPVERWPVLARIQVNGSITKLITGRSGTSLLTFNDHAHLEGDRSLITYR